MQRGALDATPDEPVSHNPRIRKKVIIRRGVIPRIMQVARASFPPGEVTPPHGHPDMWELFVCEQGEGTMLVADRIVPLSPGTWTLVAPHERHEVRAAKDSELVVTTFGVEVPAK